MAKRLTFGLVLQGGAGWVGGIEYGKNVAKALLELPGPDRAGFDLVIYAPGPLDPSLVAGMPSAFHAALKTGPSWPRSWLLRRIRQGLVATSLLSDWLVDAATADGVDFLYPFLGRGRQRDGFHSSAWIPDFQHRHLPGFFS